MGNIYTVGPNEALIVSGRCLTQIVYNYGEKSHETNTHAHGAIFKSPPEPHHSHPARYANLTYAYDRLWDCRKQQLEATIVTISGDGNCRRFC